MATVRTLITQSTLLARYSTLWLLFVPTAKRTVAWHTILKWQWGMWNVLCGKLFSRGKNRKMNSSTRLEYRKCRNIECNKYIDVRGCCVEFLYICRQKLLGQRYIRKLDCLSELEFSTAYDVTTKWPNASVAADIFLCDTAWVLNFFEHFVQSSLFTHFA